ncbi:hypothetical protein AGOR_G00128370 [Albula goreensis]|uniref:Uncharacterized protein n=1 Tax=Albula goreensis TaxID=1534307 RepID=A0A8T3DC93_9TELE|nr:hypothetical protein AGOR_G00128370 [Albula goreensis]
MLISPKFLPGCALQAFRMDLSAGGPDSVEVSSAGQHLIQAAAAWLWACPSEPPSPPCSPQGVHAVDPRPTGSLLAEVKVADLMCVEPLSRPPSLRRAGAERAMCSRHGNARHREEPESALATV